MLSTCERCWLDQDHTGEKQSLDDVARCTKGRSGQRHSAGHSATTIYRQADYLLGLVEDDPVQ